MADPTIKEEPLTVLLRSAHLIDRSLAETIIADARRLRISLEQAISMSGDIPGESLALINEAHKMVVSGQARLDTVVKASRLAHKEEISLGEAISKLNTVHKRTATVFSLTNELTSLMLESGIINQGQLARAVVSAQSTGMLTGRTLLLNHDISVYLLFCCIRACIAVREKTNTKEEVVKGLKRAHARSISIEQALFELGFYKQPAQRDLQLGDLLTMAGVVVLSDLLECWELVIVKKKQFSQIALEQGLLTQERLNASVHLQSLVSTGKLKSYQAARVLRRMVKGDIDLTRAVGDELARGPSAPMKARLGDLIVAAGIAERGVVDAAIPAVKMSDVKVGKHLLKAGVVDEPTLFIALRLQSLVKTGYLHPGDAVKSLKRSHDTSATLEVVFNSLGVFVPDSMQWLWV